MAKKETNGGIKDLHKKKKIESTQTTEENNVVEIRLEKLTPHMIFLRCIKRAQNLISFHKEEDEKEKGEQYCDAYRAAIVLSISALDAFIRTIVIDKINEKLVDSKKNLPDKLSKYLLGLLNQDKLLDAARKYTITEVVNQHVKNDFETQSFQGDWKINSFMEIVGYKDIFKEVSKSANLSKDNLIKDLNKYTKRRHTIAHSGDYDLTETLTQTENKIDKEFAQDCVNTVINFAYHVNKICYK